MEADYIGLLLLAPAAYDPRVAPKVFRKIGYLTESFLRVFRVFRLTDDYLSTHPSAGMRADLLAQAHIMEEALTIYKNKNVSEDEQGFLHECYNFFVKLYQFFLIYGAPPKYNAQTKHEILLYFMAYVIWFRLLFMFLDFIIKDCRCTYFVKENCC